MQTVALWCTLIVFVGSALAIPVIVAAVIVMTRRDHKLAMRRHCINLAKIHTARGNLEKAWEYMRESEKYRLAGPREEYL